MHARRRPEQNRQQLDLGERAHAELLHPLVARRAGSPAHNATSAPARLCGRNGGQISRRRAIVEPAAHNGEVRITPLGWLCAKTTEWVLAIIAKRGNLNLPVTTASFAAA
jgi:hypothetical protein